MIQFQKTMPNHAAGLYHKVVRWELTPESTHAVISSFATEAQDMICWQDTYTIPLEWKVGSIDDIEFILTQPGAPMAGGTIVPDELATLESAQARKWAAVKAKRTRLLSGTLVVDVGEYQIGERSIAAMEDCKLFLAGEDDGALVEWVLADNTTIELTSVGIDTVLTAIACFKIHVHAASQSFRRMIYADDATIEIVNAIDVDDLNRWPSHIGGQPVLEDVPET